MEHQQEAQRCGGAWEQHQHQQPEVCGTFQEPAGTGQAADKPSRSGSFPGSPVPGTAGVRSGRASTWGGGCLVVDLWNIAGFESCGGLEFVVVCLLL